MTQGHQQPPESSSMVSTSPMPIERRLRPVDQQSSKSMDADDKENGLGNRGQLKPGAPPITTTRVTGQLETMQCNSEDDQPDSEELLSEALLAVASAEEYAAKIIKLQQACLLPLKEDLADWLNKIMNMSTITKENFMNKLDNGVIICRLAKVISSWCYQQQLQLQQQHQDNSNALPQNHHTTTSTSTTNRFMNSRLNNTQAPNLNNLLSISTLEVHKQGTIEPNNDYAYNYSQFCDNNHDDHHHEKKSITPSSVTATPIRRIPPRPMIRGGGALNCCLTASSTTSLNSGYQIIGNNKFLNNLIRMEQTKIWEDAKCRTFYARDNVSNFIRWSKEFGVNQSVLFESDDLVLHANTRQVVLCLLDVARIACVKHGFIEAPGLVKFEQEIDRELAAEKAAAKQLNNDSLDLYNDVVYGIHQNGTDGDNKTKERSNNDDGKNRKLSSLGKNSRGSIADATDDLIMRYCIHKEEEAAKRKASEAAEAVRSRLEEEERAKIEACRDEAVTSTTAAATSDSIVEASHNNNDGPIIMADAGKEKNIANETKSTLNHSDNMLGRRSTEISAEMDSSAALSRQNNGAESVLRSPSSSNGSSTTHGLRHNLTSDNRVDSLDSGEGRTESASTVHSRMTINNDGAVSSTKIADNPPSSIPRPIKRSASSSSMGSLSTTSELSSSRSSLLSDRPDDSNKKSSDLDGKVMRIAKSYYGKGARKGVTRLSEGKYKIADRIVFVRLLKGHRVMVRIGGGWDTLENFLFRHKSDPSQVIDVDNLLPIETKMTLDKSHVNMTPSGQFVSSSAANKQPKIPYYRRSSSASSTNLSISNISTISNHSPVIHDNNFIGSAIPTPSILHKQQKSINDLTEPNQKANNKQIPFLLIHRGQSNQLHKSAFLNSNISTNPPTSTYKTNQQKVLLTNLSKQYSNDLHRRPSKVTSSSTTNLYPATLTTRIMNSVQNNNSQTIGQLQQQSAKEINKSATNLNITGSRIAKHDVRTSLIGRSNDSLQASYLYKSPQNQRRQLLHSNGSPMKRRIESQKKANAFLAREGQTNN